MRKTIRRIPAAFFGVMCAWLAATAQQPSEESKYQPPADKAVQAKLAHWQDLKFGLFMHWGTYSQWGIVESWSICPEDYAFCKRTGPYAADYAAYKKAYEDLQLTFNPTKFDPAGWAGAAKEAGMRYVVFTTKHHDGFCMFDTKYTDYRVTSPKTPFSSNPLSNVTKAVFDAFRGQGFMVGAYFSKPDWHSENFWWPYFPPKGRGVNYDTSKYPGRWKQFKDYTYNQVEELMTGYGPVDLLWLDGDWAHIPMQPVVAMARRHQPGLLVVDRHGAPEYVNYLTPEQKIPDHYMAVPWETCMTMGRSWSWIPNEKYRTSRQLVQILVDIVAKNGNLLLDIGPGPDGEWHEEARQRLHEVGLWMAKNGEAIYGTKPVAPYRRDQWAFTGNGRALFAAYLPGETQQELPDTVSIPTAAGGKITLLGVGKALQWKRSGSNIVVGIPAAMRRQLAGQPAWVFKME